MPKNAPSTLSPSWGADLNNGDARDHRDDVVGTAPPNQPANPKIVRAASGADVSLSRSLESLEVEPDDLRAELVASLLPGGGPPGERRPFTPSAKAVLEQAASESLSLGHNYIGCEHLLLGLVAVEEGLASQVLRRMGVELRTTRRAVIATLTEYLPAREQPVPTAPTALAEATAEILRRLQAIEDRLAS